MPRERNVEHPDADLYWGWLEELNVRKSRSTQLYASDVARFLREHALVRVANMTETTIEAFKTRLTGATARRMSTALGHFFHYAVERRRISYDPVYRTKYSRSGQTGGAPSLFDLLRAEGMRDSDICRLDWSDFLAPIVRSPKVRTIRVRGREVPITSAVWISLDGQFRRLAASESLRTLVQRKIA